MEKRVLVLFENGSMNWAKTSGRMMEREKSAPRWEKGGARRESRVRGRGVR